jgi:branched-chain amino acid transport system permease protein
MDVIENVIITALVMLLASLFLWPQVHYARQTSLCQAAFMGIGGYTAAFVVSRHGWSWSAAVCASSLGGALAGGLVSACTQRAREDTFTITTLGIQLIASNAFLLADSVTGGARGIFFLPPPFSSLVQELAYLGIGTAAAMAFLWFLPRSAFGRHCRALGDDSLLYEVWGWPASKLKILLGGFAGMGASLSGGLLVSHLSVAEPSLFTVAYSIVLITSVILLPGKPLIVLPLASIVFAGLPELLRFIGLDAAHAAYGQQAVFYVLLILAAFRDRKDEPPLPGALSGGVLSR